MLNANKQTSIKLVFSNEAIQPGKLYSLS